MLKKVKDSTIELLKDALKYLNIKGEVKEADIDSIFEYFEGLEVEFSTRQDRGEKIDSEKFEKICLAVDDFFKGADSEDSVDLNDLNNRLK